MAERENLGITVSVVEQGGANCVLLVGSETVLTVDEAVHEFRNQLNSELCESDLAKYYLVTLGVDKTWHDIGKVHDWRNYVPDDVKRIWNTFEHYQQDAIQAMAQGMADKEEWN